jgi:hypothetical protein
MKHAEIHFDCRKWMKLVQKYIHGRLEYTKLNIPVVLAGQKVGKFHPRTNHEGPEGEY